MTGPIFVDDAGELTPGHLRCLAEIHEALDRAGPPSPMEPVLLGFDKAGSRPDVMAGDRPSVERWLVRCGHLETLAALHLAVRKAASLSYRAAPLIAWDGAGVAAVLVVEIEARPPAGNRKARAAAKSRARRAAKQAWSSGPLPAINVFSGVRGVS